MAMRRPDPGLGKWLREETWSFLLSATEKTARIECTLVLCIRRRNMWRGAVSGASTIHPKNYSSPLLLLHTRRRIGT